MVPGLDLLEGPSLTVSRAVKKALLPVVWERVDGTGSLLTL